MPERFSRLVIMNTWLHHEGYEYSDAIRSWNQNWNAGGVFDRARPDVALLLVLSDGLAGPEVILPALLEGTVPEFTVARRFLTARANLPPGSVRGLLARRDGVEADSRDREQERV
jgi:hypothetical protein